MGFLKEKFSKLIIFLEMIKFEHSVFALPFAYTGLLLAEGGWPRFRIFFWVTLAMVTFRTMAMSANRLIDRSIDALNVRTRERALPSHKLDTRFVGFVAVLSLALFEWSAYRLNFMCLALSWIPVGLAWFYPWTKRFTWSCHFVLGIILGIAPYGAWLASQASFSWIPALLTLGVIAWVSGFDIIYSLMDVDFDRQTGLFSFPVRFGVPRSLFTVRILHLVAILAWGGTGYAAGLGVSYFAGLFFAAVLLVRENWIVRSLDFKKINDGFFMINAWVSAILCLSVAADLIFGNLR